VVRSHERQSGAVSRTSRAPLSGLVFGDQPGQPRIKAAETYLELLHNRQSIRVEWYVVLLVLIEVVLIVYDMAML